MLRYYKQKHHFINFFCKYSHLFAFGFKKFATALHFFMPLALSATTSLLQNVSICPNMSQNVSKSTQFFSKLILRHFETFWAILSGFLGQVWDILRHFELILSNFERIFGAGMRHFETFWVDFEQFWAILSGICSASNLYIWIVLSIYMSFLHNWNSQIMEIEARS